MAMASSEEPATTTYTLPPQHPDTFKRSNNGGGAKSSDAVVTDNDGANVDAHPTSNGSSPFQRAAGKPLERVFQQVYCPNASHVVTLPAAAIEHMPKSGLHIKRLVLCAHHHSDLVEKASNPTAAAPLLHPTSASKGQEGLSSHHHHRCPKGGRCKYVHARVSVAEMRTMPRTQVHVNNAWRSLEEVEYERFPEGPTVRVRCPDGASTCDCMQPQFMLRTQVRLPADTAAAMPSSPANTSAAAAETVEATSGSSAAMSQLRHCAHYYYGRECVLGPQCAFVHAVYIDPRAGKNQRAPPAHLLRALLRKDEQHLTDCDVRRRAAAVVPGDAGARARQLEESDNYFDVTDDRDLFAGGGLSEESGEHCASGRYRHDPYNAGRPVRCVRCELASTDDSSERDADGGFQ